MNHEMQNDIVDFKITKRHFPRINNESVLEFVFEKDPNLFMRKNKIIIKGAIEIDRLVLNFLIICFKLDKWIFGREWLCFQIVFYA